MITSSVLTDGTLLFVWRNGYAQIKVLAPGLLFFRKVGHFPEEAFDAFISVFDREIATHRRIVMFCDCEALSTYETGYRQKWALWFKHQGPEIVRAPILVKSAIVKMGISLVNVMVPVFEPYSDRHRFEAALRKAAPTAFLPAPLAAPSQHPA